ncbi:MAG: serine/threonine-protein kinase [Candidatus Obscuribacterales bacterium]|jgi:serine/threonine-protein kinase
MQSQDEESVVSEKRLCLLCQLVYVGSTRICPTDGTPLVIVSDPLLGTVLPEGFRIISQIGRGAMGTVYRAEGLDGGEVVAVKVLHRSLSNDLEPVLRFKREAELSSQLSHRNIVSVDSFGILDDGRPYMTMDLVEGVCLDKLVSKEGAMRLERALPIFIQLAQAISHAHSSQIVHRDIKLSNVMLLAGEGQDIVKLFDFGIAKIYHEDGLPSEDDSLTVTGQVVGSPLYMSPEQCLGQPLDNRSDIYSLGCLMHYVLMGQPVFTAGNVMALMQQQVSNQPRVALANSASSAASEAIQSIILVCLEKMPEDRYQTMEEVCRELVKTQRLLASGECETKNHKVA